MKSRRTALVTALAITLGVAGAGPVEGGEGEPVDVRRQPSATATLVWTTPSRDSKGSMPIGNGDIGANLWVEPDGAVVFYLSKTDAWSENGRLLKLGRVRVTCDPALDVSDAAFTQTLDPNAGTIRIESRSGDRQVTLLFWIDANHPAVHLDVDSNQPLKLSAEAEVWRTTRRQLEGQEAHSAYGLHGPGGPPIYVEPDTIVPELKDRVIVYHRNERSIWADNLKLQALGTLTDALTDPLLTRTFGFAMLGDGLVNASPTQLQATEARHQWTLSIYPLTKRAATAAAWRAALDDQIQCVEASDKAARLAAHRRWWADFQQRSWIRVSGSADAERLSRAYALQRWVNACGGRGNSPIKFNGSIFTVDGNDKGSWDADYRRWGGPYWWQNTRLPYWSMLSAGDFDLMRPLFEMYLAALPVRKAATQEYYGHDGAFYPETMYFWGTYTDANYGRNRAGKPDGLTDNGFIRRYWQGGVELVMMMLDCHDRTQDEAFRDRTLLPLAVEITTFFNEHWPRNDHGKIHFHPAQSLETYWDATNPMPEIVGLRAVLPRLLKLPVDAKQQDVWRKMLDDLPPTPTAQRSGKTILVPAEKWANKRNAENPEFYAVFPYREFTITQGSERLQVALNTWPLRVHKGTGGWQQTAIQAALLGLDNEAAKLAATNAQGVASGFRFPVMWGPNFDWIPDQDHGSVMMLALQRMLMQCDGDEIRVFPAWPKDWDVEFKLHAFQRTAVVGEYRNGRIVKLEVTPDQRRKDVVVAQE